MITKIAVFTRLILISVGTFAALAGAVTNAHAVAFRLPNQDPEAIARGNAFVATADNPSAIYYNPAGITQLRGHNISAGAYFVSAGTEFESPTGLTAETDTAFQPVPQLYYVYSPENLPLSFGLGIYAPFGLSIDWGDDAPFATLAQNGKLVYATINPVVAYRISERLSVGIGPTFSYSEAELERRIGLAPGDQFRFEGDGTDYGFSAGIFWHPHEKWAFGASYRYASTVDYDGESEARPFFAPTSTTGSIRYPQYAVVGVSFRPTEMWNLEFDLDWTDWDNVNDIVLKGTSFGDVALPLHYTSGFMYKFGVTRKLPDGFFASAGYFFSENSSPDQFFSPLIPDSDLHLGSIGFGRRGERWDWALAYHFGYNPGRDVVSPGSPAEGRYETLNHGFNLSATLKF